MYNLNTGITFFSIKFHRYIHLEIYGYILFEFFILALQFLVNVKGSICMLFLLIIKIIYILILKLVS